MKTILKQSIFLIALMISTAVMAQTENRPVIAIDNMNVLYVGVDNPISIAVPNVASNRLKVSIDNGSISGVNGKYIVKVTTGTEATISVAAEVNPGEVSQLGSTKFRIKRIPDPVVIVSPIYSSMVYLTKAELLKCTMITVNLNIPLDLTFEITSFTFNYKDNGNMTTLIAAGNKFTDAMIAAINTLQTGAKVYIEDIKVKGPDGTTRTLAPLNIKIAE